MIAPRDREEPSHRERHPERRLPRRRSQTPLWKPPQPRPPPSRILSSRVGDRGEVDRGGRRRGPPRAPFAAAAGTRPRVSGIQVRATSAETELSAGASQRTRRTADESSSAVLPGESLAKYRRAVVPGIRSDSKAPRVGVAIAKSLEPEERRRATEPLAGTRTRPSRERIRLSRGRPFLPTSQPSAAVIRSIAAGQRDRRRAAKPSRYPEVPDLRTATVESEHENAGRPRDEHAQRRARDLQENDDDAAAEDEFAAASDGPRRSGEVEPSKRRTRPTRREARLMKTTRIAEIQASFATAMKAWRSKSPASAECAEAAVTATVREQGTRYLHRVSRRRARSGAGAAIERSRGSACASAAEDRATRACGPSRRAERPERSGPRRAAGTPPTASRTATKAPLPSITRSAEGRPGNHRSDREGAAGPEGRAHHVAHRAARAATWSTCRRVDHIGVSRKIASDEERQRLKRILQAHRAGITGRLHRPHRGRRPHRRRDRAPT